MVIPNAANSQLQKSHSSGHVAGPSPEGSQTKQERDFSGRTLVVRSNKRVHWKSPTVLLDEASEQYRTSPLMAPTATPLLQNSGSSAVLHLPKNLQVEGLLASPNGCGLSVEETQGLLERLEATTPSLSPVLNSLPSLHSATPTLDKLFNRNVRRSGTWRLRVTGGSLSGALLGEGEELIPLVPLSVDNSRLQASDTRIGGVTPVIRDGTAATKEHAEGVSVSEGLAHSKLDITLDPSSLSSSANGETRGGSVDLIPLLSVVQDTSPSATDLSRLIGPSNRQEMEALNSILTGTLELPAAGKRPDTVWIGSSQPISEAPRTCKKDSVEKLETTKPFQSAADTDSRHSLDDVEQDHSKKVRRKRQRQPPPPTVRITRRMAALQKAFLEESGLSAEECQTELPAPKRRISRVEHREDESLPSSRCEGDTELEPAMVSVQHTQASSTPHSSVSSPKKGLNTPPSCATVRNHSKSIEVPYHVTKVTSCV